MTQITLNAYYDSSDGKYKSRYSIGEKLEVVGSVAHGSPMTIRTNGFHSFGARTNTKPLYVNLGFKTGSAWGRDTTNYYNASAVEQSSTKPGSLTSAVQYDLEAAAGAGIFQYLPFDPAKPLITYVERYYDFDINDPAAQNGSGGFNLKTNRLYKDATPSSENNAYVGYQGSEGATSVRLFVENVTGNAGQYYGVGVPVSQWVSEEFIFNNSSAVSVADGELRHYRSNSFANSSNYLITTIDGTQSTPISVEVLDQVSNGCGSGMANVYMYTGYHCRDDEYNGVYVGNASTRGACTKMVRLPQSSWSQTSADFYQIYSVVASADRYFYMRTGKTSWLSDTGVR
jgi:hypothetical protein